MSKHHQSKAGQACNKAQGTPVFSCEKTLSQSSGSTGFEHIPSKLTVDDTSIQLRAYQIYNEKGGSALDNWLEAERILR